MKSHDGSEHKGLGPKFKCFSDELSPHWSCVQILGLPHLACATHNPRVLCTEVTTFVTIGEDNYCLGLQHRF